MHDSLFVHMFEGTGNLFHEVPDIGFIELQILALFFFDKFLEISFFSPFCDDDEFVVVDERINILDDMGMV